MPFAHLLLHVTPAGAIGAHVACCPQCLDTPPQNEDCNLQQPCENTQRTAKVPAGGREGSVGSMLLSHALAVLCVVLTWLCRPWETRAPCSFHPGVAATGGCKRCPRSRGPTWAVAVITGLVPAALPRPCARPPAAPHKVLPCRGVPCSEKNPRQPWRW